MIKIGSNNIGKIYLGSNSIGKAYLGSNLVFQKGSSPSPSIEPVFYDFLVFDGTAYIDTDYTPGSTDSFAIQSIGEETSKIAQQIFRASASNDSSTGMFFGGNTSSSYGRQIVVCYGSPSYLSTSKLSFSYSSISFFLTPKRYGWGDQSTAITNGSATPTGPIVIGQNHVHDSQAYTGRMGTFFVYGSDAQNVSTYDGFSEYTPVATFRPCTYNGVPGLWHIETNTFCGNSAGSGSLNVLNNS